MPLPEHKTKHEALMHTNRNYSGHHRDAKEKKTSMNAYVEIKSICSGVPL